MEQEQLGFEANDPAGDHLILAQYAERAYLDYAVSVVKGRALPDVADGQKPVQRRILYAMNEMGLGSTVKPVKSARVVGDVLGKYHPHGDQSAYDSLVRMAQDFSLRYPLIDGQGNFGSRDGDGAAAMRYTEARLTAISRLLLDEIDQGTVDFGPNYDGSFQEPLLLPARLPFNLLNGSSGIAVGMATEIVSHNLREIAQGCVALIRDEKLSDQALFECIPGPDFPGGAHIISSASEIAEIYRTGRGSIKVRARAVFEELSRGQWQLIITELAPNTSAAKVLAEVEEITNPKVKAGKKSLSPEQQNLKAVMLGMLDTVRDESGKQAAVRLVFEPKSSRIDRDEFLNTLLAHTSLEQSVSINFVAIGRDGRPAQKSLRQLLLEWIEFRAVTIRRRTQFRVDKVLERIHVLEGRLLVFLNIDKVIKTIRESDEPRADLMRTFKLTERQADDILEIRLRQLARLESIKIEQELKELRAEQTDLEKILGDEKLLRRLMIKEIEADAKQYADERRTLIEQAQRASVEQRVIDEPVTVIVSQKGWLRARQGHAHDPSLFTFKTGDGFSASFECRTVDTLIAISSDGRAYSVAVNALPSARGDGVPITTLIELQPGARIVHTIAGAATTRLLMATKAGFGLIASIGDMSSRQRAGKQFFSLQEGDEPLAPSVIKDGAQHVWCVTSKLRVLSYGLDQIRVQSGGGKGITLMDVDAKEPLQQAIAFSTHGLRVQGVVRGKAADQVFTLQQLSEYEGKRARKGKQWSGSIKSAIFSAA